MLTLFGTPIGGGIVIGRACVIESRLIDVPRYRLSAEMLPAELERIRLAAREVTRELQAVAAHLPADAPSEASALLDVHSMILNDPALIEAAIAKVESDLVNAEWAIAEMAEELAAQFREIDDPYLKERGRDVEQVTSRVLKAMAGSRLAVLRREPGEALLFVSNDISPADMLQLKDAVGFVIERGGTNSHTAILARSMNVATIVGAASASRVDPRRRHVGARRRGRRRHRRSRREHPERIPRPPAARRARVAEAASPDQGAQHDARWLPGRPDGQHRAAARGGRRARARCGRHRIVPQRVPVPEPPGAARRGRTVRRVCRSRASDARPSGDDPHDRRRLRQVAREPGADQRRQHGAGPARDPLQPSGTGRLPDAAARAAARLGVRPGPDPAADARARPRDRQRTGADRPGPRAAARAWRGGRRARAGRRHDRGAGGRAVGRPFRAAPRLSCRSAPTTWSSTRWRSTVPTTGSRTSTTSSIRRSCS